MLGTTAVVPVVAGTGQEEVVGYSEEQYSLARERMKAVQYALEAYKAKHGTYPTTIEWQEQVNPLDGFALNSDLFDPWHRKFHYEDYKEGGHVVNYHLESNGLDIDSPIDNVPCPVAANEHLFPEESPIKMIYPRWDQDVVLLSDEAETGAINEFLAEHKNPRVFINWYLDDQKIGQTIENNTLVVELQPGEHTLLLVDENGYSSSFDFTVKRGTNE